MTCKASRGSSGDRSCGWFGLTLKSAAVIAAAAVVFGCSSKSPDSAEETKPDASTTSVQDGLCEIDPPLEQGETGPDYLSKIGCRTDFDAVAADPLKTSVPGALSAKVFYDTCDDTLYFQNTDEFQIHVGFYMDVVRPDDDVRDPDKLCERFAVKADFDRTQYYDIPRRFILAAVTYYSQPDVWALEFASYDTATAEMIELLYDAIKENSYFGSVLKFHPTSNLSETQAAKLPSSIPIVATSELYGDYQPLNLGSAMGRLRFVKSANLDTEFVLPTDIVVLDKVPNDISVVAGLITEEFQTPLSHVNVLAQNRRTPNMGLKGATYDEDLVALEGKPVELTVGALDWKIRGVTAEEATEWAEAHKPDPLDVEPPDLSKTGLPRIEEIVPYMPNTDLGDAIAAAVKAYGGKASHFSVLAQIDPSDAVLPVPDAMVIPIYYYDQFMQENGYWDKIDELLADPAFTSDPATREARLEELRNDMMSEGSKMNQTFLDSLAVQLQEVFGDEKNIRFRSSTNAEDLGSFTGAGLYTSVTGTIGEVGSLDDVVSAIKEVWASVWYFRTFEERTWLGIPHKNVGMALLAHHSFPAEEANGVALTNNPFNPAEGGFYVNCQVGDFSVVKPAAGVTTDQFVIYWGRGSTAPVEYLSESNLISLLDPPQDHVLTDLQVHVLSLALNEIHEAFRATYGPAIGSDDWYAMDVEFKFDDDYPLSEGTAGLSIKQARPHPGWGDAE